MGSGAGAGAVGVLVALGIALRETGVPVAPDRVAEAVRAAAELDPTLRADLYWAGRLTLCSGPEHYPRYDAVFDAVFRGEWPRTRRHRPAVVHPRPLAAQAATPPGDGDVGAGAPVPLRSMASGTELLRHRDIGTLTAAERAALDRALAALALPGESRASRRWQPAGRGRVDPHRTVRAVLRGGGEPWRLPQRRHRTRPRPVVLLVDVSGSMSGYADALLRFAHAAARRRAGSTEVFTIGTRLTRVTRELTSRDPTTAMAAVGAAVPDYSGGTRLGSLLARFLDEYGQRGTARGAIVVIMSDGWERGDPAVLAEQMARLSRLARRVVWANPRKGRPGFAPLAAGLVAALPYVDDFVSGHSLAALEHLARVVVGDADGPVRTRSYREVFLDA
ncbi:MAG: VWA domain-containing protein [Actinobacteria bacterium]|nr:VWA domain-containing protein [Actinomycetota bacterium]